MKKVTAEYGKNDNSAAALTARNDVLNRKLDEQKKKVSEVEKMLAEAKKEYGSTATSYEPYKQSVFQLPETVELSVFDKILPQEGKIIRQIKKLVFTGDEEWAFDEIPEKIKRYL